MFNKISVIQFALLVGAMFSSGLILANAGTIGQKLNLMDHPDGLRKIHAKATPLVAGLAILIPLFLWCAASVLFKTNLDTRALLVVLLCGTGATLVGYADDQSSTSPSSRLLSILLFAAIALVLDPRLVPASIGLSRFGGLAIPAWFAFSLVAVALAGLVNAINMADGQNGIVIGMTVIWSGCIALMTSGTPAIVALALLTISLMAFVFNLAGLAFLGDSGTYGVGFVVGLLSIWAHNSHSVPTNNPRAHRPKLRCRTAANENRNGRAVAHAQCGSGQRRRPRSLPWRRPIRQLHPSPHDVRAKCQPRSVARRPQPLCPRFRRSMSTLQPWRLKRRAPLAAPRRSRATKDLLWKTKRAPSSVKCVAQSRYIVAIVEWKLPNFGDPEAAG